jgi:hypothetical protein
MLLGGPKSGKSVKIWGPKRPFRGKLFHICTKLYDFSRNFLAFLSKKHQKTPKKIVPIFRVFQNRPKTRGKVSKICTLFSGWACCTFAASVATLAAVLLFHFINFLQ